MNALFRGVGRRLREYIRPLVGFWDLLERIEELRERVSRLEPTTNAAYKLLLENQGTISNIEPGLFERLDLLTTAQTHLTGRGGPLIATVAAEVDRLDGYLSHHAATLREGFAAEMNRLDGFLANRETALRESVAAICEGLDLLHNSVVARERRPEQAYAVPAVDALVIDADYDLIVPAGDTGLLAYILRHGLGAVEPGVRAVLKSRLKPGGVAVDAGSNIGIHTVTMASAVGREGRVVCFEPLPHRVKALERTLRLNGFGDLVRVQQMALADIAGEATLHHAVHGPMSSLCSLPDGMEAELIPVRLTTLDESFPPGARVDLVKMDVEGAEPRVWRGMRRILCENANLEVVLAWSAAHFRRSGEDPMAFMAEIRAAGFCPYVIADDETAGLTPLRDCSALEACNLLLMNERMQN